MQLNKIHTVYWAIIIILVNTIICQHYSPNIFSDPDSYYHIGAGKIAGEINNEHIFPWLPITMLGQNFADQHWLFHTLLSVYPAPLGGQVFIILQLSLLAGAFLLALDSLKINYKGLWLFLLMFGSVGMLVRASSVRADTISAAIALVLIAALIKNRVWIIAPLITLGLLWHGGALVLPVIACIYAGTVAWKNLTQAFSLIGLTILGVTGALLVHPQHVHLLSHLYIQLQIAFIWHKVIPVGNEWYPYSLLALLQETYPLNIILCISICCLALRWYLKKNYLYSREPQNHTLFLILSGLLSSAMLLTSRRYISFWTPLITLACAYTINPLLAPTNYKQWARTLRSSWQVCVAVVLIISMCVWIGHNTIQRVRSDTYTSARPERFKDAAAWLEKNTKRGEIITNMQWDEFPELFYWNTTQHYVIGLDPTFLYLRDPGAYWAWRRLSDDKGPWNVREVTHTVHSVLSSHYIFLELDRNPNLTTFLHENPENFSLAYEDSAINIFFIH